MKNSAAEKTELNEESSIAGSNIAVKANNITIAYRSYEERPTMLKEMLIKGVKRRSFKFYKTFNALKNVSFEVEKGQVLGVIGSNGAGKSTLLRVLAGVLPPTEGNIEVEGSVDSLIQLGAGFDAELNAVENIYLNGTLYRQSYEEIRSRVEKILDFAELQEFRSTPIKYYSSGMYARLGFAVVADRNPDILIIDEVLAVGDERFQQKCLKVFENHLSSGKTIVMVSHNMPTLLKISHKIGVLSKGKLVFLGDPKEAVERYRADNYETALSS